MTLLLLRQSLERSRRRGQADGRHGFSQLGVAADASDRDLAVASVLLDRGRALECFCHIGMFRHRGSGDVGPVPGGGVDVVGSEDACPKVAATGDEIEAAVGGVEG